MNTAVILAGGSGRRMAGTSVDKVLEPLPGGMCPVALCARAFAGSSCVERIVVTFRDEEQRHGISGILAAAAPGFPLVFVPGGSERADSVRAALEAIPETDDDALVFIHDGARPLLAPDDVRRLAEAALKHGSAALAHPVSDTIKRVGPDNVLEDLPRASLRAMETPQVFRTGVIRAAYRLAEERGAVVTDDAAAAALLGVHPVLVDAGHPNPKITLPSDLDLVKLLLARGAASSSMKTEIPFRIGHGYDIHRFAEGRRLVLGGVEIAHSRGLDGHSDADCLCHAVADAVLGAAGLPDIGHFFPPGRPETKDMDSLKIVSGSVAKAAELGLRVGNVDVTLIAAEPKIAPHVPLMKERLAAALGIVPERIGIKATTNEGIGGLGRAEGIAAHAVALLVER